MMDAMKPKEAPFIQKPDYSDDKGILKSQADLREFKRFNKIGNGIIWSISLTKQDAIIFEARRDVYIYGIGIYGASDGKKHDFKIKYKWIIQSTPNGETAEES
jgi:hypothetical protein